MYFYFLIYLLKNEIVNPPIVRFDNYVRKDSTLVSTTDHPLQFLDTSMYARFENKQRRLNLCFETSFESRIVFTNAPCSMEQHCHYGALKVPFPETVSKKFHYKEVYGSTECFFVVRLVSRGETRNGRGKAEGGVPVLARGKSNFLLRG